FEFLSEAELEGFVKEAQDLGLLTALAGAIGFGDLDAVLRVDPDILGVRGIVCGGDRRAVIKEELVKDLKIRLQT
ncbi:MAG: (5-formylfuran-3-yl)methyl phosphate synthase, partial [Candidatus Syntropharchaeales archaeon]